MPRIPNRPSWTSLFLRNVDLALVNGVADGPRALAVHLAADAESGTQNLLDTPLQVLGEGLELHRPRNVDDLIEGNRLVVLDVLLLLPVTGGLLERPDDEGRRCGDDRDGGLTVLDRQPDGHAETLPVTSGLCDVFAHLLGRETEGTDLGGESRRSTDLTTGCPEVDDLDLVRVDLGRHGDGRL
jgi:hypothetical protein